jgi:hypothetical protein
MNKIKEYRKIGNWENFFLASAVYSIAKSLGIDHDKDECIMPDMILKNGFQFVSAITGDMFAYLYAKNKPCDSGITNYFYEPEKVKKAYSAFGYDCIYYSNEQIKNNYKEAINAIKKSIDSNIPVLGWGIGMGNIKMQDGSYCDMLPEGCIIGGYDDNDNLFVNLYLGPDRLEKGAVDEEGYTLISGGLEKSYGIFIIGDKIKKPELMEIYKDVIYSIPAYLNRSESNGYSFGKKAFENWAETLLDDTNFVDKTDDELSGICWNLHCSPYCCVCTMGSFSFMKGAAELFPEMKIVHKLLPLYEKMKDNTDKIWKLHGDFFPPMEKFRTYNFRKEIADILINMGKICEEILNEFSK